MTIFNRKTNVMRDFHTEDTLSQDFEKVAAGLRPSSAAARRFTRPLNTRGLPVKKNALQHYEEPGVPMSKAPRWRELPVIANAVEQTGPLSHLNRETQISKSFDLLRTRLRQTAQQRGWSNIGIAAPTPGAGNTFVTTNLAMSLARVPQSRTLLMDFNMRNPALGETFGLQSKRSIQEFLNGEVGIMNHIVRTSDTLAMALNNRADTNAAEVLQDPTTHRTLEKVHATLRPELVLYDLPPLLAFDDATGFLPQLDGILLVSDGTRTMGKHLAECEQILDGQVPLLGVILNRARASSIPSY